MKLRRFLRVFCGVLYACICLSALSAEANPDQIRARVVDYAKKFIGIPYKYGGDTIDGFDCSGFVFIVLHDAAPMPNAPRTTLALYEAAEPVPEGQLKEGDLVFFQAGGRINHVGIYIGRGEFIHSASDGPETGVIISGLNEGYWKRTYTASGRILP